MKRFFLLSLVLFSFFYFSFSERAFAQELEEIQSVTEDGPRIKDVLDEANHDKLAMVSFDLKDAKPEDEENDPDEIADPFFYVNYGVFYFNDFLQNYALEPVSTGYKTVTPEFARVGVSNFFSNLQTPVNIFNHLFQLNPKKSGTEFCRLLINSTIGIGGFYDAANHLFGIKKKEAGFGQTLGYYGVGHGLYIVWPILGPSSARETIGFGVDKMTSPATYISYFYLDFYQNAGVTTFEKVNDTSFKLGDYKLLVSDAIDPYYALKDAFEQYNMKKIKKVTGI